MGERGIGTPFSTQLSVVVLILVKIYQAKTTADDIRTTGKLAAHTKGNGN